MDTGEGGSGRKRGRGKRSMLLVSACLLAGLAQAEPAALQQGSVMSFDGMSMQGTVAEAAASMSIAAPVMPAAVAGMGGDLGSDHAITAAVADGVTTGLALSAGAVELNPLVSPSPLGLLAMTGLKVGMVKYAETLPEPQRRTAMKTASAVWGGAAMNNLLVLFAAPTPLSVIAGIVTGVIAWHHLEARYEEQDRVLAQEREAGALAQAVTQQQAPEPVEELAEEAGDGADMAAMLADATAPLLP